MIKRTRSTASVLAVVALGACAGGCGNGSDTKSSADPPRATPTTGPGAIRTPTFPTATFIFDAGALKPPLLRMPNVSTVRLVVISADGRPHGVVVTVRGHRDRVVIGPGGRGELTLQGLKRGRYRIVPDGATAPVTLRVG